MGNFVGGELKINEEANMTPNNEDTKKKIIDTSQKIQEVLLLLLSDNDDLRQRLEQEASDRKKETAERQGDRDRLQGAINDNASKGKEEMNELREMILQERDERKDQAQNMDDFFR